MQVIPPESQVVGGDPASNLSRRRVPENLGAFPETTRDDVPLNPSWLRDSFPVCGSRQVRVFPASQLQYFLWFQGGSFVGSFFWDSDALQGTHHRPTLQAIWCHMYLTATVALAKQKRKDQLMTSSFVNLYEMFMQHSSYSPNTSKTCLWFYKNSQSATAPKKTYHDYSSLENPFTVLRSILGIDWVLKICSWPFHGLSRLSNDVIVTKKSLHHNEDKLNHAKSSRLQVNHSAKSKRKSWSLPEAAHCQGLPRGKSKGQTTSKCLIDNASKSTWNANEASLSLSSSSIWQRLRFSNNTSVVFSIEWIPYSWQVSFKCSQTKQTYNVSTPHKSSQIHIELEGSNPKQSKAPMIAVVITAWQAMSHKCAQKATPQLGEANLEAMPTSARSVALEIATFWGIANQVFSPFFRIVKLVYNQLINISLAVMTFSRSNNGIVLRNLKGYHFAVGRRSSFINLPHPNLPSWPLGLDSPPKPKGPKAHRMSHSPQMDVLFTMVYSYIIKAWENMTEPPDPHPQDFKPTYSYFGPQENQTSPAAQRSVFER